MAPHNSPHNTPPTDTRTLFLGADTMRQLVQRQGLSASIAAQVAAAFLRWADFHKSARVACHSAQGLGERIALVPQLADPRDLFGSLQQAASGLSPARAV